MIFFYSGARGGAHSKAAPEKVLRKSKHAGIMLTFSELTEKSGRNDTKKRFAEYKERKIKSEKNK